MVDVHPEKFGLRHLRYFLAVASEGSFRRASERLHIAQSAISRRVQELEAALGVALFERTSKGVSLSDAGKTLEVRAKRVTSEIEDALAHLKRYHEGEAGVMRLGFPPLTSQLGFFPGLITSFRDRHPSIRLVLTPAADPIELILAGALDAAIQECAPPSRAGISTVTLQSSVYLLASPPAHRLNSLSRISCEDLRDEELILFPRAANPQAYDALTAHIARPGAPMVVAHETASEETRLALTAAGLGVSLVSSMVLRRTIPFDVVFRPLSDLGVEPRLTLAWRKGDKAFPLQRFKEVAESLFQDAEA